MLYALCCTKMGAWFSKSSLKFIPEAFIVVAAADSLRSDSKLWRKLENVNTWADLLLSSLGLQKNDLERALLPVQVRNMGWGLEIKEAGKKQLQNLPCGLSPCSTPQPDSQVLRLTSELDCRCQPVIPPDGAQWDIRSFSYFSISCYSTFR